MPEPPVCTGGCQLTVADRPSRELVACTFPGGSNAVPTVTVASPEAPVLSVATTISVRPPGATVLSRPDPEIVSPAPPSTLHVTGKDLPSLRVAVNCLLPPTGTDGLAGETLNSAPGGLWITKGGNGWSAIVASSVAWYD